MIYSFQIVKFTIHLINSVKYVKKIIIYIYKIVVDIMNILIYKNKFVNFHLIVINMNKIQIFVKIAKKDII